MTYDGTCAGQPGFEAAYARPSRWTTGYPIPWPDDCKMMVSRDDVSYIAFSYRIIAGHSAVCDRDVATDSGVF
jgi:hypothetical protein